MILFVAVLFALHLIIPYICGVQNLNKQILNEVQMFNLWVCV